jgi:hypothetical protein
MLAELTMIATQAVDESAVQRARADSEIRLQQPEPPHSPPEEPNPPGPPVVPPDDPHRQDIDREPSIDPPPTDPPVEAPSEKPGITEPPRPRA